MGEKTLDEWLDRKLVDDPAHSGVGWLLRKMMHPERMRIGTDTATLIRQQRQPVAGVLVTLERVGGNGAPTGRVMLSRPQPIAAIPASGNGTP
jgi:hypothetical protein